MLEKYNLFKSEIHSCLFLENCQGDRCFKNGILKVRKNLQSWNGVYRLILNDTGNLEIWCKREKIWTTNTDDDYIESLIFDNDGKISLLGKDNSSRWQMKLLSRNSKPHLMLLQNNGNLVVYNKCGNRLWESRARGKCDNIPGIYMFFLYIYMYFSLNLLPFLLSISFVVITLIRFCDSHYYNALSIEMRFSISAQAILNMLEEQ